MRVPLIENKVSDAFIDEDEKLVRLVYLIPEYERTEEYKAMEEKQRKEEAERERMMMELEE